MLQKVYGSLLVLLFSSGVAAQNGATFSKEKPATISIKTIPSSLYTQQLSFVCKNEWLLQKKTGLPIFLRLGSKDYVDFMEQKPNAKKSFHQ